ncbi:LiaF transmembrane domain-containing protein [Calidifontibacillus oryziterrae]|uniref:LiaF transmembrane domain-containing protein n=1 Tax=Calidifontibacillus oryziterrae TaxID=1191699 RepID=UPI00030D55B0|nr:DUF5668 domain-containing protein [Calidifontibacillus oryziterrae]
MKKKQGIFPGLILIGIGIYFLMDQLNLPIVKNIFTWPTLLLIIGLSFLLQAYLAKDAQSVFPGIILFGLGVHFHGRDIFDFWPDHWAVYTLIVGIAFIFRHQKTKNGIVPGIILLVISLLGLFYDGIISWMNYIGKAVGWLESFWPVALILIGIYIIFKKR